jgi:hypothetical protein
MLISKCEHSNTPLLFILTIITGLTAAYVDQTFIRYVVDGYVSTILFHPSTKLFT